MRRIHETRGGASSSNSIRVPHSWRRGGLNLPIVHGVERGGDELVDCVEVTGLEDESVNDREGSLGAGFNERFDGRDQLVVLAFSPYGLETGVSLGKNGVLGGGHFCLFGVVW